MTKWRFRLRRMEGLYSSSYIVIRWKRPGKTQRFPENLNDSQKIPESPGAAIVS